MRSRVKIKSWQLLRFRARKAEVAMLSNHEFISVGRRAFAGIASLVAVFLPESLSIIKREAFRECVSLRSVTLSSQNAVGIGEGAFRGCAQLSELIHSDNVISVQNEAFRGCTSLSAVPVSSSVKRIGARAFYGCRGLRLLTLPTSLRSLGREAFARCSAIETLTLASPEATAPYAFAGCTSLRQVCLPYGTRRLPCGIFSECHSLVSAELPETLKKIEKKAFYRTTSLQNVKIPLGVTVIGARAFAQSGVQIVELPRTVKRLGYGAFGTGKREDKLVIRAENEYTCRKLLRMLRLCGSLGCVRVEQSGKTVEERKRERRRSSLETAPTHLFSNPKEAEAERSSDE